MKKYILGFVFGAMVFTGANIAFAGEKERSPLKALFEATQEMRVEISNLWTALSNIQLTPGPQGPQGQDGVQGIQGPVGSQGLKGDTGLTGSQGTVGPKGEIGASGTISTQIIEGSPVSITFNPYATTEGNLVAAATCPSGKSVMGGGVKYLMANSADNSNAFSNIIYNQGVHLTQSFPSSVDTWQANVEYYQPPSASVDLRLTAYAICTL